MVRQQQKHIHAKIKMYLLSAEVILQDRPQCIFPVLLKSVYIVIRKNSLDSTMSRYLIDQINKTNNISIVTNSIVTEAAGNNRLECIILENIETGEQRTNEAGALFIFIGARPVTDWIKLNIFKDSKGFIETGKDLFKY